MTCPDPKNWKAFELLEYAISLKSTPILIGITGVGGAGKTTFANNIVQHLGGKKALTIDLDDYLLSREQRGKKEVTGYNPAANQLYLAREHIEQLRKGNAISKPVYDHQTGSVLSNEEVIPQEIIVIEGVTTLYSPLCELYDVSFFLDALEETQIKSRVERDVNERGYTLEEALGRLEAVKPDYERFIAPTKKHASVVFEVGPDYVMHPIHVPEEWR